MEDTASEYFGAMVDDYDSLLRRAVPRYAEMIARTVEYSPPGRKRVLELGCGTGNLTLAVAAAFPDASFTLVDASREMLDVTAARLGPDREITCIETRFEEIDFAPGSFDLATSCISLHHVQDKASLFCALHAALEPSGYLVYCDQMAGVATPYSAINWNAMVDYWKQPGNLDAAECKSLADHADAHDHYVSVGDQMRMIDSAGFTEIDCVWRNWMWGVLSAKA